MRQSDEWFAAHKREQELYRRCCNDLMGSNWGEYMRARAVADSLRRSPQGEGIRGIPPRIQGSNDAHGR